MSTYKSAAFRVHLGQSGAYWTLVLTDGKGHRTWDRRVHAGDLRYGGRGTGPEVVLRLLRRALEECERRHGMMPPPQASASPEGTMGGSYRSAAASAVIGFIPADEKALDVALPGL